MDKKYRKEIQKQLHAAISFFLKKTDEKIAGEMLKEIKAASKELSKKFAKLKEGISKPKKEKEVKKSVVKKKAVKKTAAKKVRRKKAAVKDKAVK